MAFCLRSTTELVIAHRIKMCIYCKTCRVKALVMIIANVFFNFFKANSTNTANCVSKIFFYNVLCNSNCFKNLSTLIRLNCRNTHFCCNLYNSVYYSLVVIINCSMIILIQKLLVNKFCNCFMRKVWIYCTCTIAQTHCCLMNIAYFCSFQNN